MDMDGLIEEALATFDAREAEITQWLSSEHPGMKPHELRAIERAYKRELRDMQVRRPYLVIWQSQLEQRQSTTNHEQTSD